MPKKPETITPLTEINTYQPDRVHMALNLPKWVDQEQILIKSQRLVGLLTLAGIEMLNVKSEVGKQTSKVRPGISGMNSQGGAYGAIAKTETTPSFEHVSELEDEVDFLKLHNMRWVRGLTVKLNNDEIVQRLNDRKANLRSPDVWAEQIDQAVRTSIRQEGIKHLMTLSRQEILTYALWIMNSRSLPPIVNGFSNLKENIMQMGMHASEMLVGFVYTEFLFFALLLFYKKVARKQNVPFRWTVLPFGPEVDNVIALQYFSRRKLIYGQVPDQK
jgi:hypothetical protein